MEASVVTTCPATPTTRATQGIGFGILLYIAVTLHFYSWYWVYQTEEEMGSTPARGWAGCWAWSSGSRSRQ